MVTVRYTSRLRRDIGREREKITASTVAELLSKLEKKHGEAFSTCLPLCRVFVNGSSSADLEGVETALSSGDEVLLLLPVAGG